jgi:hypothetical protein
VQSLCVKWGNKPSCVHRVAECGIPLHAAAGFPVLSSRQCQLPLRQCSRWVCAFFCPWRSTSLGLLVLGTGFPGTSGPGVAGCRPGELWSCRASVCARKQETYLPSKEEHRGVEP